MLRFIFRGAVSLTSFWYCSAGLAGSSPMEGQKKWYLLRIELLDAYRPIWREVVVPSDLSLDVLHDVLQTVMGWEDGHGHEFQFKGVSYVPAFMGAEFEDAEMEEVTELDKVLKRAGQSLTYLYDFGDGWRHSVTLKKTLPWDEEAIFVCTGGEGACPLEDCGGVYGHEQICRYLQDPSSADDGFMDFGDWIPEDYDPAHFDRDWVNGALADLNLEESDATDMALYDELVDDLDGVRELLPGLGDFGAGEADDDASAPDPYANLPKEALLGFRSVFMEGAKFRVSEPWKDLWDQDIFAVRDPESGLLDFVSVMGRGGEVFGVHVHRPPEAYDFWHATKEGSLEMETIASSLRQLRMLELEFVNKAEMEAEDLELYERLGYPAPPRGRHRWMRVRRYHPRSVPWFADPGELTPLARGVALACRFVEAIREEPDRSHSRFIQKGDKTPGAPDSLPVFELPPRYHVKDWAAWELKVLPIDWSEAKATGQDFTPPEFDLERMAALPEVAETWEAGAIYLDEPVMTEQGPVVPILAAAVPTEKTGPMPMPYLSSDLEETPAACVWKAFLQTASQRGERPSVLQVTTELAYQTFEPLSRRSGMRLKRTTDFVHLGELFALMEDGDL